MRTVLPVDLEGEALWVVVRLLGKKVDNHHHGFLGSTFVKAHCLYGLFDDFKKVPPWAFIHDFPIYQYTNHHDHHHHQTRRPH